jgi:hypothetical protein
VYEKFGDTGKINRNAQLTLGMRSSQMPAFRRKELPDATVKRNTRLI